MLVTGTGRYDGRGGYTFELRAVDRGEPGRQRDTLTVTVRNGSGGVVLTFDGTIDRGNIQSTRIAKRK